MGGSRRRKERVKTGGRRSLSSATWLRRQLNDPYVEDARRQGFRARSVFKLQEIDQRYRLLRRGAVVIDLGAAPGSWTQYAVSRGCKVLAVDLLPMEPIAGARILKLDFLAPEAPELIQKAAHGPVSVVLSDIAADATGQRSVDRLRAEAVGEAVLDFAADLLEPGGSCLVKLLKGAEAPIIPKASRAFSGYRLLKPKATRSQSSEMYLLATGRRDRDLS